MKDKERKLEVEVSRTLGGAGKGGVEGEDISLIHIRA